MSPSKKKAAKKTTKKKAAAKAKTAKSKKKSAAKKKKAKPGKAESSAKKAGPKKSAKTAAKVTRKTPSKATSKTIAKKAAKASSKKAPAKKASAKKAAEKPTAKKTSSSAARSGAPAQKAAAGKAAKIPTAKVASRGKEARSSKRARAKKPITPTGPRHPKLGYKWSCFGCAAKFYDLGKEEPICPKCATDQRERPPEDSKPIIEAPKPKVVRPMAQLLDDEDPAAGRDEDAPSGAAKPAETAMFDEAESDAAGLDIDDADVVDGALEPPEIDVL